MAKKSELKDRIFILEAAISLTLERLQDPDEDDIGDLCGQLERVLHPPPEPTKAELSKVYAFELQEMLRPVSQRLRHIEAEGFAVNISEHVEAGVRSFVIGVSVRKDG